jgi:thioredoxin-like negative regulator of GroEL
MTTDASSRATACFGVLPYPTYLRQPQRKYPTLFRAGNEAIYPAPLDDLLDGPKETVEYPAIFLENEHLRLTILPGQGGKIWSLYDKNAGDEVFYVPDVIRPSLVANNGAWIPGGMEFNYPVGHHVAAMSETPCAIVAEGPERAAVQIEIRHPHSGLRLAAEVSLRAGEARFDIQYLAWNPTALPHRWGFWCNVGTWAHEDWQFCSKARLYHTGHMLHDYPVDRFGVDTSWWRNRLISSDSFMLGNRDNFFGYYDHRRRLGLAHVTADHSMQGMKYHTFGRELRNYWSEACFTEDGRNYTEIQSGRHETQMDFGVLAPGQSERFQETWMPYRHTGGIDWMNRDIIFQVQDGAPVVYAMRDCTVALTVDGRRETKRLRAGRPARFPQPVGARAQIKLAVDGETVFQSRYPYPGRQDPGARARSLARYGDKPIREPKNAAQHLAAARRLFERDRLMEAIRHYRAALAAAPRQLEAAFELAACLWRVGDFEEGSRLLAGLARTRLAGQAALQLARKKQAAEEFFGATLSQPAGLERELSRAEIYAGHNNAAAARPILKNVLRVRPDHIRANYIMGMLARHADQDPEAAARRFAVAVRAAPGERDLVLELASAWNHAGRYGAALRTLAAAPRAVRNLSASRKLLVKAWYETGQYRRCHALMQKHRLFNWEGELWQLDVWINATLGLCEEAIASGRIAAARRWAIAAGQFPPTLGMQMKHMSHARRNYWLGRVELLCGRREEAVAAFRLGVTAMLEERQRRLVGTHGPCWVVWVTPEDAYMTLMCAEATGDAGLLRQARGFVAALLETQRVYGRGPDPSAVTAMAQAFDEDFKGAAKSLQALTGARTCPRLLKLHFTAVKRGCRRG